MTCPNNQHPAAYQNQFDLEHFVIVIARCNRCNEYLQSKTIIKENKNGTNFKST